MLAYVILHFLNPYRSSQIFLYGSPYMAGIAAMLINVRVGLGWAVGEEGRSSHSFHNSAVSRSHLDHDSQANDTWYDMIWYKNLLDDAPFHSDARYYLDWLRTIDRMGFPSLGFYYIVDFILFLPSNNNPRASEHWSFLFISTEESSS